MKIVCSHCGGPITVGVEEAGRMIPCPFCSASILVPLDHLNQPANSVQPASASETASRPRLEVRRNVAVSGAPHCPACNSVLDEGVVVCVKCGFDFRTGTRYDTRFRRRWWSGRRILVALLLLSVAGAAAVWCQRNGGFGQKEVVKAARMLALSRPVAERAAVIELAEQMRATVASNLDLEAPIAEKGKEVELRLTNGVVTRGNFCHVRSHSVIIEKGGVTNSHRLNALDAYTRLSCDGKFREAWLFGEALVMARDDFSKRGCTLPEPAIDSMETLTNAVAIGDPEALRRSGIMYFRGNGVSKDVDYAFLYTRLSAMQGLAEAQYDLGLFYLAGIAVARDLDEGLKWIGQAADQHFYPAERYLLARKQDDEAAARICRSCLGIGKITCPKCGGFGHIEVNDSNVPCEVCGQTGRVACPPCHSVDRGTASKSTSWTESASDRFYELIYR